MSSHRAGVVLTAILMIAIPVMMAGLVVVDRRAGPRDEALLLAVSGLTSTYSACWGVMMIEPHPSHRVTLRVHVNPDGSLRQRPDLVEATGWMPVYNAVYAVDQCVGIRDLPLAAYDLWREVEATFDPFDGYTITVKPAGRASPLGGHLTAAAAWLNAPHPPRFLRTRQCETVNQRGLEALARAFPTCWS